MKEQLTIQELSAYLPWEVECSAPAYHFGLKEPLKKVLDIYMLLNMLNGDTEFKLNLLPLSFLTQEIEHKGERFVPYDKLKTVVSEEQWVLICNTICDEYIKVVDMPYWWVRQLLSWHIDIFGLIERGLAVNKLEL